MKLLFDANLSPALVVRLQTDFPDSVHVRNVALRSSPDAEIWEYAKAQGYAIVSKDTDFRERSFLEGVPPKVVWLDGGNAGTAEISELLQRERSRVESFGRSTDASVLILSLGASAV